MIILGHELIQYEPFYFVKDINELKSVGKDKKIAFYFDNELIKFCQNENISFGIRVINEPEAVIANGAGAKVIIAPTNLAVKIQELAEYYLFDSKIAIVAEDLQEAINLKVDMLILPNAIKYI